MARIGVIGTGYVGLVTAVGFSELGHDVLGMDIDGEKIGLLKRGTSPIDEAGLEPVLKKNLGKGKLRFTTSIGETMKFSDYIFVAVNTPVDDDGSADLSQVIEAVDSLASHMDHYVIIVIKSTVPVGTFELTEEILKLKGKIEGRDYDLASNPEFLREGKAYYDFMHPSRIIVGAKEKKIAEKVMSLYEGIDAPRLLTSIQNAIVIKYASNAFLATRISFINEIANICEAIGADIADVKKGLGYDPRIGHHYLQPGIGYGGPCLPKDILALIRMSEQKGYYPQFLEAVHQKNEHQVRTVIFKIKNLLGRPLTGTKIGILGLTFKPETDDVRNSMTIRIIRRLIKEGADVVAYDPGVKKITEIKELNKLNLAKIPEDVFEGADLVAILTAWPQFKELDWDSLKKRMKVPRVLDAAYLFKEV